jgi:hypothetical protein
MFVDGMPAHAPYVAGHRYVQAWDLGRRTDWTVGVTFDVTSTPYRQVDFVRLNKVPWEHIYQIIAMKRDEYHVALPVIDATGPGGDVVEEELVKRGVFVDAVRTSNAAQKLNLVNTLQSAMDEGRRTVGMRMVLDDAGFVREIPDLEPAGASEWGLLRMPPITQEVDEFGSYELDDKALVQDCVMAVALAIGSIYDGRLLERPQAGGMFSSGVIVLAVPCGICHKPVPEVDEAGMYAPDGRLLKGHSNCVREQLLVSA